MVHGLILDRIEENIAVFEQLDTEIIYHFDASILPDNVKEGNMFTYDEEHQTLLHDETGTELRRSKIKALENELFM